MATYTIKIEGMGCDNCVRSVKGALQGLGANVLDVQLGSAKAEYTGNVAALREAIEDVGFDVVELQEG